MEEKHHAARAARWVLWLVVLASVYVLSLGPVVVWSFNVHGHDTPKALVQFYRPLTTLVGQSPLMGHLVARYCGLWFNDRNFWWTTNKDVLSNYGITPVP